MVELDLMFSISSSVTNEKQPAGSSLPTSNGSIKVPPSKAPKPTIPSFPSNSTTNSVVITTQFPPTTSRVPSPPPVPPARRTPSPSGNGLEKKITPPNTINEGKSSFSERNKSNVEKALSSIFVPPPIVPSASNVRVNANIEVGRLQMEDLAEKELNRIYESYVDDLLEEVIQSDFEKPSIPEVILAVITDLTNDDETEVQVQPIPIDHHYNDSAEQVYNFSQDKARSSSPTMATNLNGNHSNGEIDYYYTRVHQSVSNVHDLSNQDSIRSTNSSNQSLTMLSSTDPSSNYLQVGLIDCLLVEQTIISLLQTRATRRRTIRTTRRFVGPDGKEEEIVTTKIVEPHNDYQSRLSERSVLLHFDLGYSIF